MELNFNFFFYWRELLYNIDFISAIHQHELVPPSHLPLFPTPLYCTEPQFDFPESYSKFLLAVYFTHGSIYASMLLSPFISLYPSPNLTLVHSLFSVSVSPLMPWRYVHQYHLSKFHIYALIYNTCFSLSDLLHSV